MEKPTKPDRIVEELRLRDNIASIYNADIEGHSGEPDCVVKGGAKSREHTI